jgi:hypothetical protein
MGVGPGVDRSGAGFEATLVITGGTVPVARARARVVADVGADLGNVGARLGPTVATERVPSRLTNPASLVAGGDASTDVAAGRGNAAAGYGATPVTERVPSRSVSRTTDASAATATRSSAGTSSALWRNQRVRLP